MSMTCVVFLDDLVREEELSFSLELDPAMLELSDTDEAKPLTPIEVHGTASLVGEYVTLDLVAECRFMLPCALCNDPFEYAVHASIREQEPVDNMRHRKWDCTNIVREAILLELPFFPQCGDGDCRRREEIQKYLVKPEE